MRPRLAVALLVVGLAGCAHGRLGLPAPQRPIEVEPAPIPSPAPLRMPRSIEPAGIAPESEPAEVSDPAPITAPDEPPPLAGPVKAEVQADSGAVDAPLDPALQRASATVEQPADDPAGTPIRVGQAQGDAADAMATLTEDPGKPATLVAARVGDTVITLRELKMAVRDRVMGGPDWNRLNREQKNQVARDTLEFLIDRAMLVQSARKDLTKAKMWDPFRDHAMSQWRNEELPAMIRRENAADEAELVQILERRGETIADRRESFMLDLLSREYSGMKLKDKCSRPGYLEVTAYYRDHLSTFDQPAQVTWREIFIPIDPTQGEAAARQLAQATRDRLESGEDFATVARQVSKSPKAAEGGLWITGYNSFSSEPVREQLPTLPIGQVSPILRDRTGLYLIRVEARRPAGPRPLPEVQRTIEDALFAREYKQALDAFLADLRSRTVITSPLFEGTDSEPTQARRAVASRR